MLTRPVPSPVVPSALSLAYRRAGSLRCGVSFSPDADPAPAPTSGGEAKGGESGGQRPSDTRWSANVAASILSRHGDPVKAVRSLLREKYTAVDRAEKAERAARIPDGGRALTRDEAAEYDALRALGKPADLKSKLDAAEQTAKELATTQRTAASTDAAAALGWNGKALAQLAADKGFAIVGKDMPVKQTDGSTKTERTFYAVTTGADGKTTERLLGEHVDAELGIYKPSLLAPAEGATGTQGTAGGTNGAGAGTGAGGVRWNAQNGSQAPGGAGAGGFTIPPQALGMTPSERRAAAANRQG